MTTTPDFWRPGITDNATDVSNTIQHDSGTVVASGDGTYYVIWHDSGDFNSGHDAIVARHFDSLGNPLGGDIVLDPLNDVFGVPFNASEPAATSLPIVGQATGVATTFIDNFNNASNFEDIYVIRTDATLTQLEPFIAVNTSNFVKDHPAITSFANGGLFVTYTLHTSTTDFSIVGNAISAAGAVGAPITLFDNTGTSNNSALATLANGNVVVAWDTPHTAGGSFNDVDFQILTSTGATVKATTSVPFFSGTSSETVPHVAALTNGGFVLVWNENPGDSDGAGIRAEVYDAAGNQQSSSSILVNTTQAGLQLSSDVTALPDGGFLVTWEDAGSNTNKAQRFDADGNRVGAELIVSDHATFDIDAATLADGRSVFTINNFFSQNHNNVQSSILDTRTTDANQVTGANFIGAGGGTGDILLVRDINGTRSLEALQIANNVVSSATVFATLTSAQHLDGAGDFNHDGLSDLLITTDNVATLTHNLFIDSMTPGGLGSQVAIGSIGINTIIDGVGDFNGDGTSDILEHTDDGLGHRALQVQTIVNNAVQSTNNLGAVGSDFQVDGIGDFNHDGTSDILQHELNNGSETLRILTVKNDVVQSATSLGAIGADFQVDGIGDFNGDGTSDILLHHDSGGARTLEVLTIQNSGLVSATILGAVGTNMQVDGIGDFNGDGTSDIELHFDVGTSRTYVIDTVVNNAVVASHSLGAAGIDFLPS